jgi:hypothetical protein
LCTGVSEERAQEETVWINVRDMAIQHWKFEGKKGNKEADIMSPQPVKRVRTGMSSMMSLYMEAAGERQSVQAHDHSVQVRKDALDAAIEQYRKIPCIDENSDPLLFWKGHDIPGTALEP